MDERAAGDEQTIEDGGAGSAGAGELNGWLKAYRVVTWVGILANLGFVLPALFAPDLLGATLGPGSVELSYVWVAFAGTLLVVASALYVPAARDPLGHHVHAWLSVVGRGMAAAFWISTDLRWSLPGPIEQFWITDGAFCVVLLVLLQGGLPRRWRISVEGLGRVLASWKPRAAPSGARAAFRGLVDAGVALALLFALPALFAPGWLAAQLGTTTVPFTHLWLGNCGMLLAQLCLFVLPAGRRPERYRVFAWSAVAAGWTAALFWLWQDALWNLPGVTEWFWLVALALAVLQGAALQRSLPEVHRASIRNVLGWLADRVADVRRAFPGAAARIGAGLAAAGLAALGYGLWDQLARPGPDRVFTEPAERFKYGAIGLGQAYRIPLYVWEVMPEVCSKHLPAGVDGSNPRRAWSSFGLIYEDGKSTPVGMARRDVGYPALEPNCALCHTGSYRTSPSAEERLILGGSAHELDLQRFQWFLYDCATSPSFTPETVLAEIEENHDLGWFEAAVYRTVILPFTKSGLALQKREYAWQKSRPRQGRGRTDTFNPTKINFFHLPDDGTVGTVDLPVIWNQRAREGMWLHWDGNNDALRERNYAAAMAVGATPYSVMPERFEKATDFVLDLAPPDYPFPVDTAFARRGWALFQRHCAGCHALDSEKVGTVTPIEEIGTDRHRLDSFTPELVRAFHSIDEGPFRFDAYRKTHGYANLPIDGAWARAPYLHNGSVPTLRDLLSPPAARADSFVRGSDVYDPDRMGFVSGPPEVGPGFEYDTSVEGNGNGGHTYGTGLSREQKTALIEYLKTL